MLSQVVYNNHLYHASLPLAFYRCGEVFGQSSFPSIEVVSLLSSQLVGSPDVLSSVAIIRVPALKIYPTMSVQKCMNSCNLPVSRCLASLAPSLQQVLTRSVGVFADTSLQGIALRSESH